MNNLSNAQKLEEAILQISKICSSIPALAEHMVNRCDVIIRLGKQCSREKILIEINQDAEQIDWNLERINQLMRDANSYLESLKKEELAEH